MKNQILIVGAILISAIAFGQKKEIKKAEKALSANKLTEAITYLQTAEGLIGNADASTKIQYYLAKGDVYAAAASSNDFDKMKTAAEAYAMVKQIDPDASQSTKVIAGMSQLRAKLVNSAITDQDAKNFKQASEKLYASYQMMKDTVDLFYAAGNAVNGQDYDTAVKYYEDLLDQGYTGIKKQFVATEIATGEVVPFTSEELRKEEMLTGKYTNAAERNTESARGDILRNVTLIYINKGQNEKALKLMTAARAENPNDSSLIRAEADMAYKMGDLNRYNELMEEVVANDPDNPELYYNLGVGSASNGQKEKAMGYYKKAMELDPNYAAAQINLAVLILSDENSINEEMNSLGTSKADYDRYDLLKEKKNGLYKQAMPYLESAIKLRPDNIELVRTLMGIYGQLGEDDKFKTMKSKLQQMEGGQ